MTALLPMKSPVPGKLAFRCPACRQWRPGFVFSAPTTEQAEELALPPGTEWICDNERSRLMRAETALIEQQLQQEGSSDV